jgi:hypothetical protein
MTLHATDTVWIVKSSLASTRHAALHRQWIGAIWAHNPFKVERPIVMIDSVQHQTRAGRGPLTAR